MSPKFEREKKISNYLQKTFLANVNSPLRS